LVQGWRNVRFGTQNELGHTLRMRRRIRDRYNPGEGSGCHQYEWFQREVIDDRFEIPD
jgi:hypothetical protein